MSLTAVARKFQSFAYEPQRGWSANMHASELDSAQTLVLLFGARSYLDNADSLRELRKLFPKSRMLGCSTAGEIHGESLKDKSICAAAFRFEHTKLATATAPVNSLDDSQSAGEAIGKELNRPGLRGVFVLSDGLKVNGSALIRGLTSAVPKSVVITGGLAGDGDRFEKTWVLKDGMPATGLVSAVGLYGDRVKIGHGSKGGWDVFGPERVVTKSSGNILFELDGKPALPLYKDYLGEKAGGLPATALLFPLSIWRDDKPGEKLVRTILAVDEKNHSMTFAGDIPEGCRAQLMRANFDRLIQGATDSAQMTLKSSGAKDACLAVAISCVGRRMVLGERTEEELESSLGILPAGSEQIGFYSYGEISPFADGTCTLHNQTMTLTTLSEC